MTIWTNSGQGSHQQSDVTPAGALAIAFEHSHTARVSLPTRFDEIDGPQTIEPGIRATIAKDVRSGDSQPISYEFDSTKFSQDQAREWLSQNVQSQYTFEPDIADRAPSTQGNAPRAEGENPPKGFESLDAFYDSTVPGDMPS